VIDEGPDRSGTGLLSILFSSLVRRYTVTDIPELIPLIKKNISMNISNKSMFNITAQDLDWITLQSTPPTLRAKAFSFEVVDLLLTVDCVYHPSLVSPLVNTMQYLTTPGKTTVVVVVELRMEDVVREFLETWLRSDPRWQIWSLGEQKLDSAYGLWMGRLREKM
jgi:protein N-lysine methyltransferase METTL21D